MQKSVAITLVLVVLLLSVSFSAVSVSAFSFSDIAHFFKNLFGKNIQLSPAYLGSCVDTITTANTRFVVGSKYSCNCSAKQASATSGNVWGTYNYTSASHLCRSAVHAGVISTSGGVINYAIISGQKSYLGSTRNGVTSIKYGSWPAAYTFSSGGSPPNSICTDSDGGINYYVKGNLTLTNNPQVGYNTYSEDYCTGNTLREVYCNVSGTVDGINGYSQIYYNCPNGCSNGACIQNNQTNQTTGSLALFPRIKLQNGGWVAFLTEKSLPLNSKVILPNGKNTLDTEGIALTPNLNANGITWTTVTDGSNIKITGIDKMCNFDKNAGPAILYIEPKKWSDASFGDYICVPLSTIGTKEIAIGDPALNGMNSGYVTYSSDTYKKAAVDRYGAFVTKEDRTNENGVAAILSPSSQMYLDTSLRSDAETVNLATSARRLYYGDPINAARTSVSSSEMPSVLGDGMVIDNRGISYTYFQRITLGGTRSAFGTSGGDLTDPVLYLDAGTDSGSPLYNYSVAFNRNLNVSSPDVQGTNITLQGKNYVIGGGSSSSIIYLYENGRDIYLLAGDAGTINIGGASHVVQLTGVTDASTARINVDGIAKTVTKGNSYSFAGGITVYVKDVTYQAYVGGIQSADLIVGSDLLVLQNGATVKRGADEMSIKGTNAQIFSYQGLISGFRIQVAMNKSQIDDIAVGESFADPVFGGLKVQFAGAVPDLSDSSRARIKIDTDNNQYAYVTFTSARAYNTGEKKITYVYDNDTTSTAVSPKLAHQKLSSNGKGMIHVKEGEPAQINDWIVINQGDAGVILQVDDISQDAATTGSVTFEDVITGNTQKLTLTNSSGTYQKTGVNFFGGNGYTVMANEAGTQVSITWNK